MATRKHRKIRTRRHRQRGGGFFDAIARIAEGVKGFFSKPTDGSVPSPGVKEGPLFGKKNNSSTSKALPSNAVAINMQRTPPPQPSLQVNKPLPIPKNSAIQASTPPNGLSSSFTGPVISSGPSGSNTGIKPMTPPSSYLQPPQLTMPGGKRRKHRNRKTQRKRK